MKTFFCYFIKSAVKPHPSGWGYKAQPRSRIKG